jgi:pimeloyl-ACP methyl ester carboxylesterase
VTDEMIELRLQTAARTGAAQRQGRMFPGNPKLTRVSSMLTPVQLIAQIQAPTLLVHGRDDQIMPVSSSYRLHELIDGSDLHVFARCGHWSQIDRLDEFNALAISFFGASRKQSA